MSFSLDDAKRKQIRAIYLLMSSYKHFIDEDKHVKKIQQKLESQRNEAKIQGLEGSVAEIEAQYRPMLDDLKKTPEIKKSCRHQLENRLKFASDEVPQELAADILKAFDDYDERNIDNIQAVYDKIEDHTKIEPPKKGDSQNFPEYSVNDYFMEMATAFHNIANGLQRVIDEIDSVLDDLDRLLKSGIAASAQPSTDSKPASVQTEVDKTEPAISSEPEKASSVESQEESKPSQEKKPAHLPTASLEDIEAGIFPDESLFDEDSQMTVDDGEIIEEEVSEDESENISSFFSQSVDNDDSEESPSVAP